jgi:YebC/PmpR family DNA-binding regulatory protein
MGAQWKHAGRQANSAKRGALISKLIKEIMVAAKSGIPHPDNNARLRVAIEAAKRQSVPRDNIDRALKRASGVGEDAIIYEMVTYEGFAPHQVPVVVECLTDNKNRTAADIRVIFRKGQLGNVGTVGWMFDRLGVVDATHEGAGLDIEGAAIEAGAQNVEPLAGEEVPAGHTGATFLCDTTDLDAVNKALTSQGWVVTKSEMNYIAKNFSELSDDQKKEVADFLNEVDDHDDVHRVYAALR